MRRAKRKGSKDKGKSKSKEKEKGKDLEKGTNDTDEDEENNYHPKTEDIEETEIADEETNGTSEKGHERNKIADAFEDHKDYGEYIFSEEDDDDCEDDDEDFEDVDDDEVVTEGDSDISWLLPEEKEAQVQEEEEEDKALWSHLPGKRGDCFVVPLKILILIIGSRGDVQPFIALAQALAKDVSSSCLYSPPLPKQHQCAFYQLNTSQTMKTNSFRLILLISFLIPTHNNS